MEAVIQGLAQFGLGFAVGGAFFLVTGVLSKWWPNG